MKTLIVFCSKYRGNTGKVAVAFARRIEADLLNLSEAYTHTSHTGRTLIDLGRYDLIGFGSGVYGESLSPQLIRFVERLDLTGKRVFTFSTSAIGLKRYNRGLIRLLADRGAICIGNFACRGSFGSHDLGHKRIFALLSRFAHGHPDSRDLEQAQVFIARITRAGSERT